MKMHARVDQHPRSRRVFAPGLAWVGLALVMLTLCPSSSRASIMLALDLPDLVKLADHIAVVDVQSVHSAWDDKHERIYSTIQLNVVERWKAPAGQSGMSSSGQPAALTVVQAGGTVGDMSMVVMGMPTFTPGARSLVFLRGDATHAQVVGMTQGIHPLTFETAAKRWTVSPASLSQVKLVRPAGAASALPARPPANSPTASPPSTISLASRVPLETMKAEVLRLMSAAP